LQLKLDFKYYLVLHAAAGKGENPEGLGSSTMGPSRFWVHNNSVPEQNADTVALLPYYRYLPHRFDNPRRWSTADCEALRQHVLTIVKVSLTIVVPLPFDSGKPRPALLTC